MISGGIPWMRVAFGGNVYEGRQCIEYPQHELDLRGGESGVILLTEAALLRERGELVAHLFASNGRILSVDMYFARVV